MKTGYRQHRGFHSFRAWIDTRGSNTDRRHERGCVAKGYTCTHLRLWDLSGNRTGHNIVRVIRRRRPLAFAVAVGRRLRGFSLGMSR